MHRQPRFTNTMRSAVGAFGLLALIAFVFAFQNCGQSPRIVAGFTSKLMPEKLATGSYCTTMTDDGTTAWKFLFIVDMSRSNIGDWSDTANGKRWDFGKATDKDGTRFSQIKTFIDTCGGSNPKNKYQVMVFANGAGVPSATTNFSSSLSCRAPFGSGAAAQNTLSIAKQIQDNDVAFWKTYVNSPWDWSGQDVFNSGSLFMMDTHYSTALDCASQILQQDRIADPNGNANYVTFFLTDGRPFEAGGTCEMRADKYDCYATQSATATANMAIDAKANNQTLQMLPVYYGALSSSDKDQALKVLNKMAEVTGGTGALSVSDVSGQDGGGSFAEALCALSQTARKIEYRKEILSVVNLTAKMVGNKLMADSDMDGVPDDKEVALGYDPVNRRTYGLFDSICQAIGTASTCAQARAKLSCTGRLNNLGLSDCDLLALGIVNSSNLPIRQFGIDTDRDGIPDLIEIIRGTNPTRADADEDMDNDGMSNQAEIGWGTDPMRQSDPNDTENRMLVTEVKIDPKTVCATGSEAWQFDIQQMPVVPTLAYTSKDTPSDAASRADEATFDFSHAANENVVLVTYKLTPANVALARPQLWGAVLKVKVELSPDGRYRPTQNVLPPRSFFFLGELK